MAGSVARKDSSHEGDKALYNFICACLARRLLVATPLPHARYDLIVHNRYTNEMWRVQVKKASRNKSAWFGPTHRKKGVRYPPGLVGRFVFEKPVTGGFWILDGSRLDNSAGRTLYKPDWENWVLFGLRE